MRLVGSVDTQVGGLFSRPDWSITARHKIKDYQRPKIETAIVFFRLRKAGRNVSMPNICYISVMKSESDDQTNNYLHQGGGNG